MKLHLILAAALLLSANAFSQTAEWIWTDRKTAKPASGDVRYLRKNFNVASGVQKAVLNAAADGEVRIFLNGKEVAKSTSWKEPVKLDVTKDVKSWSENTIAVEAKVADGKAGVIVVLELDEEYGKRDAVMTDRSWLASADAPEGWNRPGYKDSGWSSAALVAKFGAEPWGNIFNVKPGGATPAEEIKVVDGFKIELLKSATPREGSWVSMAVDDKGRLYISPQNQAPDGGILRITLDDAGHIAKEDWINLNVGTAMGMLWAFDSLYVSGQGPDGQAIYRLRDTKGGGDLDKVELLKKIPGGGGEHGSHGMVLGPDNKIYITNGNATPLIEGVAADSPVQHYAEDDLLPRIKDPVATFFDNVKSPYGCVYRTDPDGKKWELFAAGFRNAYDLDFNADGELFTYDSDMEWDVGLPWYRATRILHIIPGAEFGFREGTSKWPDYYADSLGSVVDIGRGCPTGVKFGTKSNFPEKYKTAFFVEDWTYGRILAVHMKPKGSTYTASNPLPSRFDVDEPNASEDVEVFLSGKALPVTALVFGKNGAMYFTIGGRGTQAGLYRVSYVGEPEKIDQEPLRGHDDARGSRLFRRQSEEFQGHEDARALNLAWTDLDRSDRDRNYAARIAIERQAVPQWRDRALAETHPRAALTALLALARIGSQSDQEPLLKALTKFPLDSLDEEWKLNKLRVIEVSLIRQGRPSEEMVKLGIEKLSRQYPAKSFDLNRELSQLLVWLDAPDVVDKTLALMRATPEHAEQIWYANVLREAKRWTPAQREQYFAWFNGIDDFKGGNSFKKFILRIREEAAKKLTDDERTQLAAILDSKPVPAPPPAPAVVRAFQKNWTLAELAPDLPQTAKGRDFARGKEIFASVQCVQCHHFGKDGGNVGPDLSAVGNRFNAHDILESIIEPSKVISEQYASVVITMQNGETYSGLIAEEDNARVCVITDSIAGKKEWLRKPQIKTREVSKVSIMPPGLIDVLTKDEILDLLAYLASGGDAKAAAFAK